MAKYKEGDSVVVREDLHEGSDFGIYVNDRMAALRGSVVTIARILAKDKYRIAEDGETWTWTEDLFDGIAEKLTDITDVPTVRELYALLGM